LELQLHYPSIHHHLILNFLLLLLLFFSLGKSHYYYEYECMLACSASSWQPPRVHPCPCTHATRRLEHIISGSSSPAAAPAPAPRRWPAAAAAAAASSPLPSCCQSQPTALPPLHQPKPHLRKPRQRISTTLHRDSLASDTAIVPCDAKSQALFRCPTRGD
jgi:hypothetical protein